MTNRTRSVVLGAILPLSLLGGAAALVASWRDRLPDPMALHWGVAGVDRVGSLTDHLVPLILMTALLCVPAALFAVLARGAFRRGAVGLSAGVGTLIAGIAIGTTAVQLDAPAAEAVPSPGAAIVIPLLAAVVIGILATWLAGADPREPAARSVPTDAARLSLPDGGTAVWVRALPSIPVAIPVLVVGLLVAMAVTMGVLTGDWWMLAIAGLVSLILLAATWWRVRIDRTGMVLTSILGWPRYTIPADEVIRADVVEVNPIAEFGGWGVRAGRGGRLGFVTRRGEAIEVERTGQRTVVVTVDDAARGAALLNTLAERSRTSPAD